MTVRAEEADDFTEEQNKERQVSYDHTLRKKMERSTPFLKQRRSQQWVRIC